ncbi:MAG: methyltransferase domain-containing protein [Haloarculaceae archaeon]
MAGLLDAMLANPWATLDAMVEGPLHPGGRDATADLLDRADVGEGTRLLDVGCGAGDALALARERGAEAWGVDRSPGADRAVVGDAAALPLRGASVDVVLAECVLCLTDVPRAVSEAERVLAPGGRLALSDVVVADECPEVPAELARAFCLTGARQRETLVETVEEAGLTVEHTRDHREDLLAMRDRVGERVDYEGLLGTMGERGRRLRQGVADLEAAVEDGDVGYVSVVARA